MTTSRSSADYDFVVVDNDDPKEFAEQLAAVYNQGYRILQDEKMHVITCAGKRTRYTVLVIRGGEEFELHS